jgi:hypothetical protein
MRGKWEGQFRINKDFTEKIKEYNMLELAKKGVFSFSQNLNEVLEKAAQFDEATQFDFMSNYFTQLENFVSNNLEYVYFERIAIKVTQNFYNKNKISYFPEDNEAHKEKYCFEINSLRNTGLISLVINKEQLDISKINSNENQFNNFINYISSYFIYSIESIVAEDEAEELAEFIFSISSNTFSEILDDENCIVDQIIDVLRAYGFNINDYEGNCEIYPNYYLKNSVNSGYDYVKFCKDIISELFCE